MPDVPGDDLSNEFEKFGESESFRSNARRLKHSMRAVTTTEGRRGVLLSAAKAITHLLWHLNQEPTSFNHATIANLMVSVRENSFTYCLRFAVLFKAICSFILNHPMGSDQIYKLKKQLDDMPRSRGEINHDQVTSILLDWVDSIIEVYLGEAEFIELPHRDDATVEQSDGSPLTRARTPSPTRRRPLPDLAEFLVDVETRVEEMKLLLLNSQAIIID